MVAKGPIKPEYGIVVRKKQGKVKINLKLNEKNFAYKKQNVYIVNGDRHKKFIKNIMSILGT